MKKRYNNKEDTLKLSINFIERGSRISTIVRIINSSIGRDIAVKNINRDDLSEPMYIMAIEQEHRRVGQKLSSQKWRKTVFRPLSLV